MRQLESDGVFERLRQKVSAEDADAFGQAAANEPNAEQRLAQLEKSDRVEQLLQELKSRVQVG